MDNTIRALENKILLEIEKVIKMIINDNPKLHIQANSRVGAEISAFLEKQFVIRARDSKLLNNPEGAPDGATKHPWDARVYFDDNKVCEEIWLDFKAFKTTSADSNPDIGTPDKVIKFIKEGNFYLCFVHVFYESAGKYIKFVKHNNKYANLYFLKDISSSVRRNPKNQLQVNISKPPTYRTREQFIFLLFEKIKESHQRQIEISRKKLKKIWNLEKNTLAANKKFEAILLNKIGKKK